MTRDSAIAQLSSRSSPIDLFIIGGGATGFACALDALSRGLSVALVDRNDFGEGTSSRSTKLIHGGVRYLRQGHIGLVRESLRERSWFLRAAPHLVHPLEFIIPCRTTIGKLYYRTGMAMYDALAGPHGAGRSAMLTAEEVRAHVPGCAAEKMAGGVRYIDGQFDDARMIVCFLREVLRRGGIAVNHMPVVELIKESSRIAGVVVEDRATGQSYRVYARAVINATGVFTDSVCHMDSERDPDRIAASQGIHLILDASYLGGSSALMIPKTSDGRVLFAVPWHGRVLYGTTDTPRSRVEEHPDPLPEEIAYLLEHAHHIFAKPLRREDIIGSFAGLRPLPRPKKSKHTSAVSRDFVIDQSTSGLVSIYGGKWTTCRAMGEAAVARAAAVAGITPRPSATHGMVFTTEREPVSHLGEPTEEWVAHAVREEMAQTVDDVLMRRTRLGMLDPAAAARVVPRVADWIERAKRSGATGNT